MSQHVTVAEKATYLDRTTELFNRARAGTLPMRAILACLQRAIEGDFGRVIDLDADPVVPDGYSVEEHRKGGMFYFDPNKVGLHFADGQTNGGGIAGAQVREALQTQPIFNANLLDWFLRRENQPLIPDSWECKAVLFWGTFYRKGGALWVRYLRRAPSAWVDDITTVEGAKGGGTPAAVLIS